MPTKPPPPATKLVLSCRLTYSALGGADPVSGADGYLARARGLTSRAEALGASLVGWSATTLAFAWDLDSVEEAIEFAVSLRDEAPAPERAWTCGVAEGPMEVLATGGRMELAWGAPLVLAVALARVARPGEVLLDAEVGALRAGALATLGARVATDAGRRVRGWRLDTEHAWRHPPPQVERVTIEVDVPSSVPSEDDVTLRRQAMTSDFAATVLARQEDGASGDRDATTGPLDPPTAPSSFDPTSSSPTSSSPTSNAIPSSDRTLVNAPLVDAPPVNAPPVNAPIGAPPVNSPRVTPSEFPNGRAALAAKLREVASGSDSAEALRELRAERAKLEGSPPAARCQLSLALGVALALAGRPEEALLEGLDALARAREDGDAKGLEACVVFLAKLYAGVGRGEEADKLRAKRSGGA